MIMRESLTLSSIIVAIVMIFAMTGCRENGRLVKKQDKTIRKDDQMSTVAELEQMLIADDIAAVNLAQQIGDAAWPAINRAAKMSEYRSRQLAMMCAGKIGGTNAGIVLAAGISDQNINVRSVAAKQLSENPPESAKNAVLSRLSGGLEKRESIQEFLILAAGYFPGDRTVQVLQPIANGDDSLAEHAKIALAKIGDSPSRQWLVNKFSNDEPQARYEALEQLYYVDDSNLAQHSKRLLGDRAETVALGPERNPKFRRVCDQAVDTLVHILNLKPPFETNLEKIYSEEELKKIVELAK